MLYEQPSVVCLWTGIAHLADQDEPGFERLSSTSSSTISASTRRGSVRRTLQVAKTRGDGYVLPRTRHPMMMMKDMPLTYSGLFRHCVLLSIMYIFIMFWTHAIPWLMAKLLMQATWSCYISGIQRTLVKDIPCCNKWHRCKRFIWRYPAKRLYRSRPPVVTGRISDSLSVGATYLFLTCATNSSVIPWVLHNTSLTYLSTDPVKTIILAALIIGIRGYEIILAPLIFLHICFLH